MFDQPPPEQPLPPWAEGRPALAPPSSSSRPVPVATPVSRSDEGNRRLMIGLGSAALVLVAVAVTTVSVQAATRDDDPVDPPIAQETIAPAPTAEYTPDYTTPAEPEETETPTEEPALEETTDPEQEALDALEAQQDTDLPTVSFNGQYVAQLASKVPGMSDRLQVTAQGSHVFGAADILAEHRSLRDGTTDGTPVVLLKSTDYGKRQKLDGQALWVTFALGAFADADAVRAWCRQRFPDMSGDQLGNQCAVRTLRPGA